MKNSTGDSPDPKRAISVADAMLNAAQEEAVEKSEELAAQILNPELRQIVRKYFEQGYLAGVLSVIQKEIYDRLASEIAPARAKAAHDSRLKVATPGTARSKKARAK